MKRTLCMMLTLCLLALMLPAIQAEEVDLDRDLTQGDGMPADTSLYRELELEIEEDTGLDLESPGQQPAGGNGDASAANSEATGPRYVRFDQATPVYAAKDLADTLMTLSDGSCALVVNEANGVVEIAFAAEDRAYTAFAQADACAELTSDEVDALIGALAVSGSVLVYEGNLDRPLPWVEPEYADADDSKDAGADDSQDNDADDSKDAGADDSKDAGNDKGKDGQASDKAPAGGNRAFKAPSEGGVNAEPQEGRAESKANALTFEILDDEETFVDGLTREDDLITPDASEESLLVDEEEAFCTLDPSRDSDELFAAYVQRMFFGGGTRLLRSRATSYCRESLSDQCKIMYDELKPEIIKVAEGSRSSTLFSVLLSTILGKTEFYAKDDLNLDLDPPADGKTVPSEAKAQLATAYLALYDCSLLTIVDTVSPALWLDCTYELYWLDRYDVGVRVTRKGAYVKYDDKAGDYLVYVQDDASITFMFPVLDSYALVEDGQLDRYMVDTTLIDSAKQASANAKAIVRKYEDCSDYVKLYGYAMEICRLVNYNYDSADDDWMQANPQVQDPWKLIWVFDDDPDTKVVCEGYAQAYKYLCELSSFSGNVGCWHVTGYVPGGAHSWNIVRMDDGKNYVVDVTWMDDAWDGQSGSLADWISNEVGDLFLCGGHGSVDDGYDIYNRFGGYTGMRQYRYDTLGLYPASALTLADSKYILKGWQAIDGYAYYFDDEGHYLTGVQLIDNYSYEFDDKGRLIRHHLTGKQTIDGKEFYFEDDGSLHTNHIPVDDPAVAVTDTADGLTAGSHCSVCDAVLVAQQTVHCWNDPTYTWASNSSTATAKRVCANDDSHIQIRTVRTTAAVAQQPTCTEKGKTTYTAVFPNTAFETQTRTVADIPATGHSWGSPGYTWADDNSSVTARRECATDPSHVETETVKTTAVVAQQATCTEKGKTTYTAQFSNTAFETQTRTVEDIPAKGHSWGNPGYTWVDDNGSVTARRACADDPSHVETETAETTAAVAQQATCTEKGKTTYTAQFSNDGFAEQSKTVEDIPAKGHSWGSATYAWADDNGSVTARRECADDPSHVETETVKTTAAVAQQATCTEKGKTTYTAQFSNTAFETQTRTVADIPATGHSWGSPGYTWADGNGSVTARRECATDPSHVETETVKTTAAVAQQATCTEKGKTTYTAQFSNDGFAEQSKTVENIPATGHSWGSTTYAWADDNDSVTARRVCANDASHIETETVKTTADITKQVADTAKGKTTYTAKFSNSAFTAQRKTVMNIPAADHAPAIGPVVVPTYNAPDYSMLDALPLAQPAAPMIGSTLNMTRSGKMSLIVGVPLRIVYTGKEIKSFKTSNKKVAAVRRVGNALWVDTMKPGKAIITIKPVKGKRIRLKLTVNPIPPTSVIIKNGETATLKKGQKLRLNTEFTPLNANSRLTWKSSDRKVATVNRNGKVTAKKPGVTIITVTTQNQQSASIIIAVTEK